MQPREAKPCVPSDALRPRRSQCHRTERPTFTPFSSTLNAVPAVTHPSSLTSAASPGPTATPSVTASEQPTNQPSITPRIPTPSPASYLPTTTAVAAIFPAIASLPTGATPSPANSSSCAAAMPSASEASTHPTCKSSIAPRIPASSPASSLPTTTAVAAISPAIAS
ncbi:hypothetical protein AB1Y20_014408 [Prymnesium parvum]|uniref:Uncharacterized protein n=1 Tax=Prymnesium parvum TaxID=97485 RepID=A0AB34IE90_PRYPA